MSPKAFLLYSYPVSSDLFSQLRKSVGSLSLFFAVFAPQKSLEGSYWVVSPLRAGRRAGRQAPICPWVSESSVLPRDTEPFSPPPPIPSSDWVLGRWRGENNTPLLDRSGKHFYNPPSAGKSLPTRCPEVSSKPGGDIWVGLLIPSLPLPACHPVVHS